MVALDSRLPSGTFRFKNSTSGQASAVVLKQVNGMMSPFYISSAPVLKNGGTETMTPKNTVALWFEKDTETGTMISKSLGEYSSFDMTGRTTLALTYDGSVFVSA